MLAAEIVKLVMKDLSDRGGLDIVAIVDDVEIYDSIVDDLTVSINEMLQDATTRMLRD